MQILSQKNIYIGIAGWSIPSAMKTKFSLQSSHLETYATGFNCVEINSSFYKHHKAVTYRRWATMVPDGFKYSVKLSKEFTHIQKLKVDRLALQQVILEISELGEKWGALLVQLPPSLKYHKNQVEDFLFSLREFYPGTLVWEARHVTWSAPEAFTTLEHFHVQTVIADPDVLHISEESILQSNQVNYFRLHGSPEIYKSKYDQSFIKKIFLKLQYNIEHNKTVYCIFDNTTYGFAFENAFDLSKQITAML